MRAWYESGGVAIHVGHVLDVLAGIEAGSVQTVVTSPPYWSLRDYSVPAQDWGGWIGHLGGEEVPDCLAWARGQEPCSVCFVCHLVTVFRAVRRVLRDDGTCWINLGDSYASHDPGGYRPGEFLNPGGRPPVKNGVARNRAGSYRPGGIGPKNLLMMPARVALALQADGWVVRSDIVWSKSNPMPESVTDRPTKSHEYLFLLSKRADYYYDAEAIREPMTNTARVLRETAQGMDAELQFKRDASRGDVNGGMTHAQYGARAALVERGGRNRRSVWTISTESFSGAHFATFARKLVEPCILAGTSARGQCPACRAPWRRCSEPTPEYAQRLAQRPYKDEFDAEAFRAYLRECREAAGLSKAAVDTALGTNTAYSWWEGRNYMGEFAQQMPTWDFYIRLKAVLGMDDRFDDGLQRYRVRIEGAWQQLAADPSLEGNRKSGGGDPPRANITTGWEPSCRCGIYRCLICQSDLPIIQSRVPALRQCPQCETPLAWQPFPSEPQVVLDIFLGSGTTAYVARHHGRRAVGIELNEGYAALAVDRLKQGVLDLGVW